MMRQSLQAVLPEISGNKTSLLRKSVCSDILTLFNSPHSALPSLLVSGMPEWQVHNQSDKHLQSWYCRQLRSALLGVVCGRGRNPTLRLWPAIFSGEIDVFPSERRNMGQEIGR